MKNETTYFPAFQKAKLLYSDQLRRKRNKEKSTALFPMRTSLTMVDKKKKMDRLEQVRKDVQKGMRRLG